MTGVREVLSLEKYIVKRIEEPKMKIRCCGLRPRQKMRLSFLRSDGCELMNDDRAEVERASSAPLSLEDTVTAA
jgi:hypothetical protein